MIVWKDLDSEIHIPSIKKLIAKLDCLSSITLLTNYVIGNRIYIKKNCHKDIIDHVRSNDKEVGGLLLGRVYELDSEKEEIYPFISVLTIALASEKYKSSSIALEMNTEIWIRANDYLSKGMIVLGWYHSHPNLGAFFSSTDKFTQASFFNHKYSLGLVIDPFQKSHCIFTGPTADKYQHKIAIIDYDLEMA